MGLRWRGGVHADCGQQHSCKQANQNMGCAVKHLEHFQRASFIPQARMSARRPRPRPTSNRRMTACALFPLVQPTRRVRCLQSQASFMSKAELQSSGKAATSKLVSWRFLWRIVRARGRAIPPMVRARGGDAGGHCPPSFRHAPARRAGPRRACGYRLSALRCRVPARPARQAPCRRTVLPIRKSRAVRHRHRVAAVQSHVFSPRVRVAGARRCAKLGDHRRGWKASRSAMCAG